MLSKHSLRKDEHLAHALSQYTKHSAQDFEKVRFVHHAFPEIDFSDVSIATHLDTLTLNTPFFINAMTGGSQKTAEINQKLALVARECDLAIATGSMSVVLKQPELLETFTVVRKIHSKGLVFANIGAHHTVESAKKVVDLLQADALQIHTNVVQEMVMPEGERAFSGWLNNIEAIVKMIDVPVIVKEVGFGISQKTLKQLHNCGVTLVDVSGRGGTNFAQIENARRQLPYPFLNTWGQTTVESLKDCRSYAKQVGMTLIASGGVKNTLDMAKCFALGASAVGMSGQLLNDITRFPLEEVIAHMNQMKEELAVMMTVLGALTINDLKTVDLIVF